MREIKFRAFQDGVMYHSKTGIEELCRFFSFIFIDNPKYNDTVLMRYTGLKDKNGVEIYEHDVILLKDKDYEEKNETGRALSTYEFNCVVFKDGCFKIGGVNLGDYVDGKYLDIIQCGNIYENKEVYRVEEICNT